MMRALLSFKGSKGVLLALFCGISSPFAQTSDPSATPPVSAKRLWRMERLEKRQYGQRAFPLGYIPPGARQRALDQITQAKAASAVRPFFGGGYQWFNLGPSPIHGATSPDAAGRVSAIAVDPGNQKHWLIGAAQGGIWESSDAGASWSARTDDQASLAGGAIAFAPGNPQIVYAGTGEADFSGDSYAGMGLLKSLNGGLDWFLVTGAPFADTACSEIKVNSSNPDVLVLAASRGVLGEVAFGTNIPPTAPARGIFVSQNGGTNWTHTLTGEATDVEVDPGNFNHQYAALGEILGAATNGVYRSVNGGVGWSRINGPWMSAPGPDNFGRVRMAIAPSNPNRLYVSIAWKRVSGIATDLLGIWRTDNAWAATPTWTQISDVSPDAGSFPWYSQDLLVHPTNPDILYFAGINVWRWDGANWQAFPNQHPDQHALAWQNVSPGNFRIIATHDGGVSSRAENSGSWASHLNGLAITQFYKGAVNPDDSSLILGASQDNGTEVYNGDPGWQAVFGGDGYSCAIGSAQPAKYWAVSHQIFVGDTISRTKDGSNFASASSGIDSSTISFFIDFIKHPVNDDIFVAGAINLWRCENFFSGTIPNWTSNSPSLHTASGREAGITAMAFAPSDTLGRIYAYGTEDGQLRLTSNAGGNWIDLDAGHVVPDRYVSGLAFSPTNAQELYLTLSGFDEGTPGHSGHVFKTTNALAGAPFWQNVSPPVNLPQDSIAINPTSAKEVFVGSDIGVWHSVNGGQAWSHLGPEIGLPNVAVFDLQFDTTGLLTAFTHGRGAFVYRRSPIILPPLCEIGPCWPGWINPGDLVEINLPLRGVLPLETKDLTVSLRATPQITPQNGSQVQTYGSLSASLGTVVRQFQFEAKAGVGGPAAAAASTCGGIVQAIFDLQDNGQPLGSITIPFVLGRLTQPLLQNFDGVTPPLLPQGWSGGNPAGGPAPWVTTSNGPPNVLVPGDPDEVNDLPPRTTGPVSISVFAPDPPSASDSSLSTPMIAISTARAVLRFRHSFDLASTFDGGVLEIAIGTQPFTDILQLGGSFAQDGYNATLVAGSGPLGGRAAWSGNSGGWLITEVNLPARAAQQSIRLRWRLATGANGGGNGWFIDDVAISEYPCAPPAANPVMLRPGRYNHVFGFYIDTVATRTYYVEFKNSLNDAAWQLLRVLSGDGLEQFVNDPQLGPAQRFYRFRVE